MMSWRNIIGFGYAVAVGVLLYHGWDWVHRDIRGTPLDHFQVVAGVVFVFAVLWIAEKLGREVGAWFGNDRS